VIKNILDNILLFVVLINPISKVIIILGFNEGVGEKEELEKIALKSTIASLLILISFVYAGTFILKNVFRIHIFSLQISAGIVLFLIGLRALQKGNFFEINSNNKLSGIYVTPIALPMIAGPATITAAILQSSLFGSSVVSMSIFIALMINLLIMLITIKIHSFLRRWGLMDFLVKITGLFVASIGADMILLGIKNYLYFVKGINAY